MGWVRFDVSAPTTGVIKGRAEFRNPTQEWLDALMFAMRNRIRFPCPKRSLGNEFYEDPMIVTNLDLRTEDDPYSRTYGVPPISIRVATIDYLYEP